MRFTILSVILIALAVSAAGAAAGPKAQTACPVMDAPINKDIFVDHNGSRVYFCCPACVDEFRKDPEKYLKKMAADGVTLENSPVSQTACPVMGEPINKDIFVDHNGSRVYFCCPACVDEFRKDPEKYLRKMAADGVTLENSPVSQTVCPVSGHPIRTESFLDHDGSRIYFCGDGCKAAFQKDPKKYSDKIGAAALPPCGDRSSSKARSCGSMKGCGSKV